MSYPMVMPALCAIAGVGLADGGFLYGWLGLFIFGLGWSFYSRRWVWLLSLCCGVVAGGLHFRQLKNQVEAQRYVGKMWSGQAVVQESLKNGRVMLKPVGGDLAGECFAGSLPYGHVGFLPGDLVQVSGRLESPPLGMNPAQFDQREWLHRQGVELMLDELQVGDVEGWKSSYGVYRMAVVARDYIRTALWRGLEANHVGGKVMLAMFLGERPTDEKGLIDDFKFSGTIHVFAVSGLHVMMIGGLASFLLRCLGVGRRVWIPLCVVTMFFYALVTGLNPPALRAAIMGTIFLSGWLLGRRSSLGNSLAMGCLIALMVDGHVLYQPGFQLSFAVLLAIALLNAFSARCFGWVGAMDPFLPRSLYTKMQEVEFSVRKWLRDALAVGGSAWCGSFPFLLWHFGMVTPIAIVASLPLVLLVFGVLSMCCLSIAVGAIHENAGAMVNRVCAGCAVVAHECARGFANVPGGHFVQRPWSSGERIVVFSVSEGGGCSYLGFGGGVLLDTAGARTLKREVAPSLQNKGARVDSVILSHADAGHCGGLSGVLEMFSLKQVLLPEIDAQSIRYKQAIEAQKSTNVSALLAVPGMKLDFKDGVYAEVLWAPDGGRKGWADDRCLVLRVHWRGYKILFMNDAGYQVEQWLDENGVDVSADVLVAGKHRSDSSLSDGFLQRVSPKAVVLSSAIFPEGEWRDHAWLDKLQKSGVEVFSQDRCGAVVMEINERGVLGLRGHLQGSYDIPPPLKLSAKP